MAEYRDFPNEPYILEIVSYFKAQTLSVNFNDKYIGIMRR